MKLSKILGIVVAIVLLFTAFELSAQPYEGELGVESSFTAASMLGGISISTLGWNSYTGVRIVNDWYPTLDGDVINYLEFYELLTVVDPTASRYIDQYNNISARIMDWQTTQTVFAIIGGVTVATGIVLAIVGTTEWINAPVGGYPVPKHDYTLILVGSAVAGIGTLGFIPLFINPQRERVIGANRAQRLADRYNEQVVYGRE